MRKILSLFIVLAFSMSVFAQEDAVKELKKQAADAYKAKDFKTAYESYHKAIEKQAEEEIVDTALHFKAAVCAYKAKNYGGGADYFLKCVEFKHEMKKSYLYGAVCLDKADRKEEYIETLEKAIVDYPDYAKFGQLLGAAYLSQGLLHYNEAADIIEKAKPLAKSDVEKYNAEIKKADAKFAEAQPLMEKAHEYNPDSEGPVKALIVIYTNLDMNDKAAAMKKKLK